MMECKQSALDLLGNISSDPQILKSCHVLSCVVAATNMSTFTKIIEKLDSASHTLAPLVELWREGFCLGFYLTKFLVLNCSLIVQV